MAKRIYVVAVENEKPRLIKAQSALAAMRHVWDGRTEVDVASQDMLVRLVTGGVNIEETKDDEPVVATPAAPAAAPGFLTQDRANAG